MTYTIENDRRRRPRTSAPIPAIAPPAMCARNLIQAIWTDAMRRRCNCPPCDHGPTRMIGLICLVLLILTIVISFWLCVILVPWAAVWAAILDFLSPTARLARQVGWAVLVERY